MNEQNEAIDPDDIGCNTSANICFDAVLEGLLSRRHVLRGSLASAAGLLFGGVLAGCDEDYSPPVAPPAQDPLQKLTLNFEPVAHSVADALVIPPDHHAQLLYALGDPLTGSLRAYANDGSEPGASFAFRAGDHHDGMQYFGLSADGRRDDASSTRGLIAINHEDITQAYLHPAGPTPAPRPTDEALKEINAHGVSVFEIVKQDGGWMVVAGSPFNRRITPNTWTRIAGPAAGHPSLRTLNSASSTMCRGTINNCAGGRTPWGTYLTCEENWAGYFYRPAATDNTVRGQDSKAVMSLMRYGVTSGTGRYAWRTAAATDPGDWTFRRWDATQSGVSADGSDDFRNEPNTFGYVVEIDPYDPASMPVKRTALGRFAHENAAHGRLVPGRPLAFYLGDDSRGEYLYKFVSSAPWNPADTTGGLATGDKYLDAGRLYAARFNADGTGEWLPLTLANPDVAASDFGFAEEAEIFIHTRIAADAAGATKMDRPEWVAVNPANGEIYLTLTNNNNASRPVSRVDAANPRSYGSGGNANGHIIRLREDGDDPAATRFTWDIYLFGAPHDADAANVNVSGLTADNDFSSPDGLWFDPRGVLWIQTDDGAYTGTTNCMMLAAIPGRVGDGGPRQITSTVGGDSRTISTRVGAAPTPATLRRFLVGPKGSEITGITMTPDGTSLFVNIQHPGEDGDLENLQSTWPALDGISRPRSAMVVITRRDGGTVGGRLA
jgi:secreted PhoX family phosphatase